MNAFTDDLTNRKAASSCDMIHFTAPTSSEVFYCAIARRYRPLHDSAIEHNTIDEQDVPTTRIVPRDLIG